MPVVCTAPLGHKTKVCQPQHFHWPPLKGLFICLLLPAYPYTGLLILLMSFGRKIYLPAFVFVCILLLLFYFCLLFLLNILYILKCLFPYCMRCNSVETYKAEQTIKIVWEVGLYFILAYFSKIIKLLFPLRYPIFCDTLFFGGFDTSICMCSLQASASIISSCFYSHNFLSMIPISAFIFP